MFRNHEKCVDRPQKKQKTTHESSTTQILDVFKEGDLVFGLITGYRLKIKEALATRNYPFYYANQLNCPVVGLVVENSKDTKELNPSQKKHYNFLMSLRNYLIRPNGKPVPSMKDEPIEGAAYRRACKALVRNANQKKSVHFELSGIDMARVCKKEKDDLGVTNSELRAAYRQAKKEGENPYLFFYLEGQSCPAPWKEQKYKEHWLAYDQLREKKKTLKSAAAKSEEKLNASPKPKHVYF